MTQYTLIATIPGVDLPALMKDLPGVHCQTDRFLDREGNEVVYRLAENGMTGQGYISEVRGAKIVCYLYLSATEARLAFNDKRFTEREGIVSGMLTIKEMADRAKRGIRTRMVVDLNGVNTKGVFHEAQNVSDLLDPDDETGFVFQSDVDGEYYNLIAMEILETISA